MEKVLFIVDVQQKYDKNFTEEYLNKLKKYIAKNGQEYKKIVMIMENNKEPGDFIPKDIHQELTIRPIFKCYDEAYSLEKLKNSKNFKLINGKLIPKIKFEEGTFCIQEGAGFLVGKKEDDKLFIDYMGRDLYLLLNMLRPYEIELVGGGLNHCVKKTKDYFNFIGIKNVTIKKNLCYSISYQSNPCNDKFFDIFIENKQKD